MTAGSDILLFGTGSFAARILFDIAATASSPVSILIAGRKADRLAWLRTAANARAAMFGRPASFETAIADLSSSEAAAGIIGRCRPAVIVQAASLQTASVISSSGNAWANLVAEGGLSATAVFQAVLSARVARAVKAVHPQCHLINCCFADVVNPLIAAMDLPVTCGIGNVAILATAFAGHLGIREGGRVQVLAHYQNIAPWRRAPDTRKPKEPPARVWLNGSEIDDVYARFAGVQLTPEPVIDISGASGVPLMLAMAAQQDWRGHVPGPGGLPGGYPVALRDGQLGLDLPPGLSRDEAVRWNAQYEADNGLIVDAAGRASFTGRLHNRLRILSSSMAEGFNVRDLEDVHREMLALRARLEQQSA
ncbi:MAG: hypothetical protein ACM31O_15760 [Bacteroidota bacterium]